MNEIVLFFAARYSLSNPKVNIQPSIQFSLAVEEDGVLFGFSAYRQRRDPELKEYKNRKDIILVQSTLCKYLIESCKFKCETIYWKIAV